MKLCVSSEDCLEMVRFDGIDDFYYPEWFQEYIKDGYIINEYPRSYICYAEDGEYAIAVGDVFLRNRAGRVRYMPVWMFTEKMYEVRATSSAYKLRCVKGDVLELSSAYELCCVKSDVLEWTTVGTNEVMLRNKKGFQRVITRTDFWRLFLEII